MTLASEIQSGVETTIADNSLCIFRKQLATQAVRKHIAIPPPVKPQQGRQQQLQHRAANSPNLEIGRSGKFNQKVERGNSENHLALGGFKHELAKGYYFLYFYEIPL